MRKFTTFLFILAIAISTAMAQAPQQFKYQAALRDTDGTVMANEAVNVEIVILEGSTSGSSIFSESHDVTTTAQGIINLNIGSEADLSAVDWSADTYFIQITVNGTVMGASQLLSVPYAMHAQTAETVTGEITETDPVFGSSPSSDIQTTDISNWNEAYIWGDHSQAGYITNFEESDPLFSAWDKSTGISITESQISDLGSYIETETDPAFTTNFDFAGAANGDLLQFDGSKFIKFTPDYISDYTVTEGDVTAHQGALQITESQVTDLQSYLTSENDPVFSAWDKSTGISITESQVSDLGTYIETETDPSVPTATQTGEMQYWDGSEWVNVPAGSSGQILVFVNGKPTWGVQGMVDGDVHNPVTDKVWMDRNLGASQVATASDDPDSYGDLYQWGRAADGHESRTSENYDGDANGKPSTYDESGDWDGKFITTNTSPYDWLDPQDDNLWQGVSGHNNPCPSGYRLPTEAEWDAEIATWDSEDAAGAFGSPLKLPVAGRRSFSNGSLGDVGSYGYYWSSKVSVTYSQGLVFYSSDADVLSYRRGSGSSVRCIKD